MTTKCCISAKNLGALALPNFCPRCFWLKLRLGNKLPWQIFPGIFSSIDAFSKQVTNHWFQQVGTAPPWLKPFGDLVESIEPPHWSRFSVKDEASGVELRGVPDHLFREKNGAIVIVDNKTARFTEGQDALLPLYEVQLNAYAWIAERKGFSPVSRVGLVYFEPPVNGEDDVGGTGGEGFNMPFRARAVELFLNSEKLIPPLLREVQRLHDLTEPPAGRADCKDCAAVGNLLRLASEHELPMTLASAGGGA